MSDSSTSNPISQTGVCPVRAGSLPDRQKLVQSGLFRRYVLAVVGIVFVGIGWVGAFLPGIPTVGPLLVAMFCFARSCPWLEQRLIRNRFFAPFLQYIDGDKPLPTKARLGALAMMWTSITASCTFLIWTGRSPSWLVVLVIASGLLGTIVIWRFRRSPKQAIQNPAA